MSPYLRKVKTASEATAVQVVAKENGVRRIVEHLGSAHDEAELAALMHLGHQKLLAVQQVLDLGSALDGGGGQAPGHEPGDGGAVRRPAIISRRSGWSIKAIKTVYARLELGKAAGGDRAFEQIVVARLIEPASKADTPESCPRSAGQPRPTATPCKPAWPGPKSGATARQSVRPCSITSPPVGVWPCACRRHHPLLRGRA